MDTNLWNQQSEKTFFFPSPSYISRRSTRNWPKYINVIILDDLMAEAIEIKALLFLGCLPKVAIEIPASYCCFRICFLRGNLTPISAGIQSTWLFSEVLAIGNKSELLLSVCSTRIAKNLWQLIIRKQRGLAAKSLWTINRKLRQISRCWATSLAPAEFTQVSTKP